MAKEKKLILMNGRGFECRGDHIFLAAHSIADGARLMTQAYEKIVGRKFSDSEITFYNRRYANEIRVYFGKGGWGVNMEGVTPERGLWYQKDWHSTTKPKRII